jgi:hypothetical protein
MKSLRGAFDWIARISAVIGVLLILLAGISSFTSTNILGFGHLVNYFHAANSFFLIAVILYLHNIKHQKE